MSVATDEVVENSGKRSKLPLLLGVLFGLIGAGGGYFAVSSGLLAGSDSAPASGDAATVVEADAESSPSIAAAGATFVPIDPLVISISDGGETRFLRFAAQLDVTPGSEASVAQLMPRIVDVLNGYLRAVSVDEMSEPGILTRLRGQMLRRVQVVTGPDQVRDLLIMEFVLN